MKIFKRNRYYKLYYKSHRFEILEKRRKKYKEQKRYRQMLIKRAKVRKFLDYILK